MGAGQFVQPILDLRDRSQLIYLQRIFSVQYKVYWKPYKSRWFIADLKHYTSVAARGDVWYIDTLTVGDLDKPSPLYAGFSVVNPTILTVALTNWDRAISPTGDTWSSGVAHGNEELTAAATIYVDEKPVSMENNAVLAGKNCGIASSTKVLKHADKSDLASAVTELRFEPDAFYIFDELKWLVNPNISIDTMYWPMVAYIRGAAVTTKGRLYGEAAVQDISAEAFAEVHKDTYGARVWNDTNKFQMDVEVLNPVESLAAYANNKTPATWITNSALYNKLYFTRIGNATAATLNDVWRSKSKFKPYWAE